MPVRGVFVDANGSLADIFEQQNVAGDPPVHVNRDADITPEQMPAILDGAEIVIIDHTPLPTEVAKRCAGLKHVVFLGTGARSYMNPEELAALGIDVHLIKGYGDTAVAECAIALMWAAARGLADRSIVTENAIGAHVQDGTSFVTSTDTLSPPSPNELRITAATSFEANAVDRDDTEQPLPQSSETR